MRLANDQAAIALTMLNKFCHEVRPHGSWRWQCAMQNGALLPLDASFSDGFLRLTTPLRASDNKAHALNRAIVTNGNLAGGVKVIFNPVRDEFHLCADLVVIAEQQFLSRLKWALDGFHDGLCASHAGRDQEVTHDARLAGAQQNRLTELLQETQWECHPRGEGEYSVTLDAKSAPPATLSFAEQGLNISVEVARAGNEAQQSQLALAVYLLTAAAGMRLVRPVRTGAQAQQIFLLAAQLPPHPEADEVDHALAALSVAYRQSANEAIALLDQATAQCYLAVRDCSIAPEPNDRREEN